MKKSKYTKEDFKASKPAVMGLVEVLFNRRLSTLFTRLLIKTPITPNQVTWLSFLILLPGVYLLSTGERGPLIVAGILIQLSFTLDCCDGEIARLRGRSSSFGAWLDGGLDRVAEVLLFTALGQALYHQTGQHTVWIYTFLAFAALFMTHIITLMTTTAFGKGNLEESRGGGYIGKLAGLLRVKPQYLRNYLRCGIDVYLMAFALGAIFDRLMWINYFFIAVQNMYWIAVVVVVLTKKD